VCEARLELVIADLLIARSTGPAGAAGTDERHGDPIADVPASHELAFGRYHARQFMARYVRHANVGIVSHPAVPITSANAGRFDGDDHAVIGRSRVPPANSHQA
jgi:hypothetical protein